MWSKWFYLTGFLCVGGRRIADTKSTLLADSAPLDIIPEELFGLPLNLECNFNFCLKKICKYEKYTKFCDNLT